MPPPDEGVAVNVTELPAQIVPSLFVKPEFSDREIVTLGAAVKETLAVAGALAHPPEEYVTE